MLIYIYKISHSSLQKVALYAHKHRDRLIFHTTDIIRKCTLLQTISQQNIADLFQIQTSAECVSSMTGCKRY